MVDQGDKLLASGEKKFGQLGNKITGYRRRLTAYGNKLVSATDKLRNRTGKQTRTSVNKNKPNMAATARKSKPRKPLVTFDYEETQLYNLGVLSLKQKKFVAQRLNSCIRTALRQAKKDKKQIVLIRESFRRIARDTEIAQRAIIQRVHELNDQGAYEPSMQAKSLLIMDKLAFMALTPFRDLLTAHANIAPITFFSQETHVQGVPYSDEVILVGVRYDQVLQDLVGSRAAPPPFELLAIPHEVGHYIYNRASIDLGKYQSWGTWLRNNSDLNTVERVKWQKVLDKMTTTTTFKQLSKRFPTSRKYLDWCEEIFADMCGSIVAGPLTSLGLQSILATHGDKDDREHPTGVLRPFILSEMLTILHKVWPKKYSFNKVAQGLSENWADNILPQLGYTVTYDAKGVPTKITETKRNKVICNISDELEEIRPIIYVYARLLLQTHIAAGDTQSYTLWSSTNDRSLKGCASELENIATWVNSNSFKELRPATLTKTLPPMGRLIQNLIDEWDKKGPVAVGDHG